jgi:hypothetical protein
MAWESVNAAVSPLSGIDSVDSLVARDHYTYNYELPFAPSITFSFDVSVNVAAPPEIVLIPMSETQKANVLHALGYISGVTGISFEEAGPRDSADIVFAYYPAKPGNAGVDYADYMSLPDAGNKIAFLDVRDTVLLNINNPEQVDPAPGSDGYVTILHEVGHALGLKHPFEESPKLPVEYDNESYTVMSYTPAPSGIHPVTYGPVDLASLKWLYGGDGLRREYGLTVDEKGEPVAVAPPDFGDPLLQEVYAGSPLDEPAGTPPANTVDESGLAAASKALGLGFSLADGADTPGGRNFLAALPIARTGAGAGGDAGLAQAGFFMDSAWRLPERPREALASAWS